MEDSNFQIVERARQNLDFIAQLQEQVTICRRLLTSSGNEETNKICVNAVQELETLLWASIKKDNEYFEALKKINEWYSKQLKEIQALGTSDRNQSLINLWVQKSRFQFRELLVFIDKKKLMPYAEK